MHGDHTLEEYLRLGVFSLLCVRRGELHDGRCERWMPRRQYRLPNRQGLLIQRLRLRMKALRTAQLGQFVVDDRGLWMFEAPRPLLYRQGAFIKFFGLFLPTQNRLQLPRTEQKIRHPRRVGLLGVGQDGDRLPAVLVCFLELAHILADLADIVERARGARVLAAVGFLKEIERPFVLG